MQVIELSDASEVKLASTEKISSPIGLKRWWLKRKAGSWTMWNVDASTFGARFALGTGEGAGLMVCDSPEWDGRISLLVEGTSTENIAIRVDGYDDELAGATRMSAERLLELLTHLMEHGEIGPGKWDIDGDVVDTRAGEAPPPKPPGAIPDARGPYSKALVQLLRSQPARARVLDDVLALVGKARDDDFKAFLAAYAHHQEWDIDCGDWLMDAAELWDDGSIQIGTSGGGDPYLMRGRQSIVMSHETGEEETYYGLEGLLAELVFQAHDGGRGTDLDAITGEEAY